ncbi:MAG: hypothetical protein HZB92_00835 [Euryarchaeota archaeon]|nr:hypothetical protein [Euryarchaeota archaeon]
MTDDTKELIKEVRHLREELRQIREVVNSLVQIVMEMDEFEDEPEFPSLPGSQSPPSFNN